MRTWCANSIFKLNLCTALVWTVSELNNNILGGITTLAHMERAVRVEVCGKKM